MADDEDQDDELELDDFGGPDLPPPPHPVAPNAGAGHDSAPPPPPPPELVAISKRIAASGDNLEQMALVHAALCASIADVLADTTISAADRRRELRTISAAAAKCFPYKRLYEAEQMVLKDRAELEERRKERAGARLEKRAIAGGKVIPIRGTVVGKDPAGGIES